ncbi:MAG: pro-sigmaK processing inhibitor BofA family protein [Eubacteriales bacterium]|nr:pro-sigmaK processing inhibitor BofA family protein [Eubacteriales bacterium]
MKNKAEFLINFMMRAVFGMIAVYMVNAFLDSRGIQAEVGMNPLSFLTAGALGLPGVALLYGIRVYLMI